MTAPASSLRAKTRLHGVTLLIVLLGMSLGPAYLSCFHAAITGSRLDAVFMRLPPVAWTKAHTGLDWLPQSWLVALLAPLILFGVALLFERVVRRYRLDPHDDAWTSLVWTLRTWRGWLSWLVVLVVAGGVGTGLLWLLPDGWFLVGFVPVVVVLLAAPFMAYNAGNLRAEPPPACWSPRWPGFVALAAAVLLQVVPWGFEKLLESAKVPPPVTTLIDLVLWVPSVVVSTFCLLLWLARAQVRDAALHLRTAMRLRILLPVLVQEFRIALIALPLLLPVLAWAVMQIFVVPQVEDVVRHAGADQGAFWYATIATSRWLSNWWWTLVLPFAWFALVAPARMLVQLGAVEARDSAAPRGRA